MRSETRRDAPAWRVLFAVVLALAGVAHAGDGHGPELRVADIVAEQQRIRAEAEAEERGWDNIPLEKRQELATIQDQLLPLLEGKQTLGDLAPAERASAVEKLEKIEALALEAENERMVCMREKLTGTHRTQTVCRSIGDMKRWRNSSQDFMRQGQQNSTMGASGVVK